MARDYTNGNHHVHVEEGSSFGDPVREVTVTNTDNGKSGRASSTPAEESKAVEKATERAEGPWTPWSW